MRQVYPGGSALTDAALAALYDYPDLGAPPARWLRANMVASLDGAATVDGRSGGLSNEADQQVFAMLRAHADVILVGAGTARAEGYGPVRPESEGLRWAWLRDGRPPSAADRGGHPRARPGPRQRAARRRSPARPDDRHHHRVRPARPAGRGRSGPRR